MIEDLSQPPGRPLPAGKALDAPAGYRVTGLVREGERVVIYSANRKVDNAKVLLKTPNSERSTERDLAHLDHEFSVLNLLAGTPVSMALAMEDTGGRRWLVLQDDGGQPLNRISARFREPLNALSLGLRIAGALAEVHRRGVIHRDLKPHHVIVLDDDTVRLTDFRAASLVRVDNSVNSLQGTFAYMAPEQTGRMNRPVDKRSDLYALGVTLYELLTGQLPFYGNDPLEWVHAHIAKTPLPPSQMDARIPAAVDAIVLKLLSKHAEDRYYGATGLQRDLNRCIAALQRGHTKAFALGTDDVPDEFRVTHRLYGRQEEVAKLVEGFDRARSSGSCMVTLIGGYSGIGKSALVGELFQPIVRQKGRFASGKFDQYKRDIPYATVVQAFRDLCRELLAAGEETLGRWRDRIREALGANGRLIVDVVPELELIIGPQPPVLELDPHEGQNRFEVVFSAFVRVFARADHPLVVFLDDMQWADGATLGLLKILARPGQLPNLQLILAFRDSEVGASHPFQMAVDAMAAGGAAIEALTLGDLPPQHVLQLVADTLLRKPTEAEPLARVIGTKAGGNPFFIGELLAVLHARGLLAFDVEKRGWTWDDSAVRAIDVTANVVDLLIDRIRKLPDSTIRALTQASCFGSRFDVGILAKVLQSPLQEVEASLHTAAAEGVVVTADAGKGASQTLRFQHDRIQQAAYSLVLDERDSIHLRIGRVLRERFYDGEEDMLFDAVKHLDHGSSLIIDVTERQGLVELNLLAGRRAKAAVAWEPARVYLHFAESLLGDHAWTENHATTFAVIRELAECEFLVSRFAAAEAHFDELRARAGSRAERGEAANSQVKLYIVMGRYDEALRLGLTELGSFGEPLAATSEELAQSIVLERDRLALNLAGIDLGSIVDRPLVKDPEARAVIILLTSMAPAVYSRQPALFPLLAMRTVNLSLEHGNCEHSCFGYSLYAMMLAVDGDAEQALMMSEASIALNERLRDPRLRGTVLHIHANHIVFWRRPFTEVGSLQQEAYLASMEVGDLTIAAYVSFMGGWQCLARGQTLGVTERAVASFEDLAQSSHHTGAQLVVRVQRQYLLALAGLTKGPLSLSDEQFDADDARCRMADAGFETGLAMHDLLRVMLAWHHGDYPEAELWLAQGAPSLPAASALPLETTWALFDALTAAALWDASSAVARSALVERVVRAELRLRGWARGCPENFGAEHALVEAELARLHGRIAEASYGYEKAADAARLAGTIPVECIAAQLSVKLARSQNMLRATRLWFRESCAVYAQWGATAPLKAIESVNSDLLVTSAALKTESLVTVAEQLDVLTAIKASQALSRETTIDGLTGALLRVVLEHSGAQRAVALLVGEGRLAPAGFDSIDGKSSSEFSESVVRFVERTCLPVVLEDASRDQTFGSDAYIIDGHVRSVLCLPILAQSRLVGVLYLENNLIADAFSPGRLALLEVVSTQLAISLQNAKLYEERQQRAEQAARQEATTATAILERSRLASFFEQAPAAILVLEGPEHMVTLDNPPYIRLVGGRPMKGFTVRDALFETVEQGFITLLDRVFASGERYEGRETLFRVARGHDGAFEEVYVNFVYQPFRDAQGAVQGIMVFAFEVTDLVRARDERQTLIQGEKSARRDAEAANRAKDEFLAMLGHELRNPLVPIVTALHILGLRDGDRNVKERSIIERQVTHLVRLVDDLLDVSRITSGKVELKREPTELAEVVAKAIEMASPLLEQRRHELTVTVPRQGLVVNGDLTRLAQVVSNLLANAAKYTEVGGHIEIVAERSDGTIAVRVRDTGIGIAPEMLPRVFDLFAQESQALSRSQGGLGLGLAIVRSLVELHGGKVWVQSEGLGSGSEFTVQLPAVDLQVSRTVLDADLSNGLRPFIAPRNSRVLVVDDNEDGAEMIAEAIRGWGYTVEIAYDGPTALRIVTDFKPTVALLDIGLPVMDGYELALQLKEKAGLRNTYLVALTGYGQNSDKERSKHAGFHAHLVKPIDIVVLRNMIAGWCAEFDTAEHDRNPSHLAE